MLPSQVFVFALTSISLAQFHFSTLVLTQLTLCPCLMTTSPKVKGYVCVSFGSCRFSMSDFSVKQKICRCLQKKKMGYVRPSQSLFMLFIFCPWLCLSVCLCLPVSVYLPPPTHFIPLFYRFKWQQQHKKWLWYYGYTYSVEYNKQHCKSLVSQNFKPSYWTSLNMCACMGTCSCFCFNFC